MNDGNRFWICDASFHVGTAARSDDETYTAIRDLLRQNGFTCHQDPETKKRCRRFPSIYQRHHAGRNGEVLFNSKTYETGCRFEFYENVVRDNPNGGRYHFDKLQKMPYLRRLKVILILKKISQLLQARGFTDTSRIVPRDAMHQVEIKRGEWMSSHGPNFYDPVRRYAYNITDRDKVVMNDGDVRWMRSPKGHLIRGRVYYNANNMWMLVASHDRVEYTHSGAFFTWRPDMKRKLSVEPKTNIGRALSRAIKGSDYLRAHNIQQAIKRIYGLHEFKVGDRVQVDNERFRGEGEVRYLRDGGAVLGVLIGNGNTWEYESSTAKPIELVAS